MEPPQWRFHDACHWHVESTGPQAPTPLIEDAVLPCCEALVIAIQPDPPHGTVSLVLKRAVVDSGPVSHLALELGPVSGPRGLALQPVEAPAQERVPPLLLRVVLPGDVDGVGVHVLAHHVPRPVREPQALTLANCVEPYPPVEALRLPGLLLHDEAGPPPEVLLNELAELDLPQEADALAVLPVHGRQAALLGQAPHLGLGQDAQREHRPLYLRRTQACEEVCLVLLAVRGHV